MLDVSVKYELNKKEFERLNDAISRLPGAAESVINQTLKKTGGNLIVQNITPLIPVSRYGSRVRPKKYAGGIHASEEKWSAKEHENLSITVKTKGGAAKNKGSFGYLVFPNEGRGPHNFYEQEFMETGLERATPAVVDEIERSLLTKIEEEL